MRRPPLCRQPQSFLLSSPPPPLPPPDRCLPGLAPPSPSSQSVRLFSMVAARRRAGGMAAPPRPRPSARLLRSLARSSSLALRSTEEETAVPARPAHTHSHTDTRSHPRAPPLSGGAAHLIPYAEGVSHWRGWGGREREGRRGTRGWRSVPGGPLALKLRVCTSGIKGVLRETGPRLP